MPSETCPFCTLETRHVVDREGPCLAIWTDEAPVGSAMVVPAEHRHSPWDLTSEEWSATQVLLRRMRERVDEIHGPDGWNVGWNVGRVGGQEVEHVHCHLVPRYADERHAGRGLRWWFKQPDNARPPRD